MTQKTHLTNKDVDVLAKHVADKLKLYFHENGHEEWELKAYAVPRGGIPAAYAVQRHFPELELVDDPAQASAFIDDIIDSGITRTAYTNRYETSPPFFALVNKLDTMEADTGKFETIGNYSSDSWIVFPWEATKEDDSASVEDNVVRMLQYIGEDPTREGLLETPKRVVKAWNEWFSGYGKNPADVMKVFKDGGESYDDMVIVHNTPIYSFCEHHISPIVGFCTVAYIKDEHIIGLSKIPRLIEMFMRRLQVQERLATDIASALQEHLKPLGVAVSITARHMCMESRGINSTGTETTTLSMKGAFKTDPAKRAEFLLAVSNHKKKA